MVKRAALCAVPILAILSCTSASFSDRPDCSEEAVSDWRIPASWYLRALNSEEAFEQVLIGNLGVDAVRERWEGLQDLWRDGDQYWRYRRPEERWISHLGWQEGVVLNRGCTQLGFVTTSVQPDDELSARP